MVLRSCRRKRLPCPAISSGFCIVCMSLVSLGCHLRCPPPPSVILPHRQIAARSPGGRADGNGFVAEWNTPARPRTLGPSFAFCLPIPAAPPGGGHDLPHSIRKEKTMQSQLHDLQARL